jgi:molybdate transport system substrate-binding protein
MPDKHISRSPWFHTLPAILLMWVTVSAHGAETRIAVASNFRNTALAIAEYLETNSSHRYQIISGSTGKLASQIINGAPFDIFMAADQRRPRELESRGLAVPGSVMPYALGELGLWWPDAPNALNVAQLAELPAGQVCIANPAFAPYGEAAMTILKAAPLDANWLGGLIRVDNINLVTAWVATGQARAGFVARSAMIAAQRQGEGVVVPDEVMWLDEHPPIAQAMAVMKRAAENPAAAFWVRQLRSAPVQAMLVRDGYRVPQVIE